MFADTARNPCVLCNFDSQGVGTATYRNGYPALVCTERGFSVYSKEGNLVETGSWPRRKTEAITLTLTDAVKVSFQGRTKITIHAHTPDAEVAEHEFHCGLAPRRTDTYLTAETNLGKTQTGKVVLDVDRIRQRFKESGHLYGVPGPHSMQTLRPGLGSLSQTIRSLAPDTPVRPILDELDACQNRVRMINTLPRLCTGTMRKDTAEYLSPEELGTVTLTRAQERLRRRLEPKPVVFERKRSGVSRMPQSELSLRAWGPGAPNDTLVVLCCHATWVPASRRALNAMEELQVHVLKGQRGVGLTTTSNDKENATTQPSDSVTAYQLVRPHATRIALFNVDVSEGEYITQSKNALATVWNLR